MTIKRILFAFIFLLPAAAHGQPSDYYGCPVDIPVLLSANYGEMRTNRFHTGIDIKTQGVEGHRLYAAADGYIARVGAAGTGYGRVLYIDHPNGTTTVYAHMQRFTDEVEEWLRSQRYSQQRSDINAYPEANRFPVKKGDFIGLSGNSGSSMGPHLHFEVRRQADSRTLNVRTHGWMDVKDDVPPRIIKLYHIEVDTVAGVPVHSPAKAYEVNKNDDGNYSLVRKAPLAAGPSSYFVIEATDRMNDVHHTFGIYRALMSVDGVEAVDFVKDELLFDHNRYCCAAVYYDIQRDSRNEAVMLALKSGNRLPMYKKAVDRGVVSLRGKDKRDVVITVWDDALNESSLSFTVERRDDYKTPERPQGRIASERRDFMNTEDGLTVIIPKGALYEPMFYSQSIVENSLAARADSIEPLSPLYRIGDGFMPLHRAMKIAIEADIPVNLRNRACIASVSDNGRLIYEGGGYADGSVSCSMRDFGTFCVVSDTIPPTVTASFKDGEDLSRTRTTTLTATDNFSGIAHCSATIDGHWIIFEREASKGRYIHHFDMDRLQTGRDHLLEVTVRDGAGNTTVFTQSFHK